MAKQEEKEPQEQQEQEEQQEQKPAADYEHELAEYLQQRIKPGLNSGAIPLLARSIAKEIAHRGHANGTPTDSGSEDQQGNGSQQSGGSEEDAPPDFETEMHDLQAELGEDWILRFSVQGEDAWLTAEKDDGSQRIEAPTAAVLSEAVGLINEGGGRSE